MRLLASERLQGTAVNPSDTQLNRNDGQGGGPGALLPSQARLQRKALDRFGTEALRGQCTAVAANLELGIRMPGSCTAQPRVAVRDMHSVLCVCSHGAAVGVHGVREE
jgi:hypothetical protein